jgi:hypothetical protein
VYTVGRQKNRDGLGETRKMAAVVSVRTSKLAAVACVTLRVIHRIFPEALKEPRNVLFMTAGLQDEIRIRDLLYAKYEYQIIYYKKTTILHSIMYNK